MDVHCHGQLALALDLSRGGEIWGGTVHKAVTKKAESLLLHFPPIQPEFCHFLLVFPRFATEPNPFSFPPFPTRGNVRHKTFRTTRTANSIGKEGRKGERGKEGGGRRRNGIESFAGVSGPDGPRSSSLKCSGHLCLWPRLHSYIPFPNTFR